MRLGKLQPAVAFRIVFFVMNDICRLRFNPFGRRYDVLANLCRVSVGRDRKRNTAMPAV